MLLNVLFCDALISIREEIAQIENGKADIHNNVLKGAPHPPSLLMGDSWTKPYSREYAAFPASWLRRVDNVYGDRNLICTLLPVSQMDPRLPLKTIDTVLVLVLWLLFVKACVLAAANGGGGGSDSNPFFPLGFIKFRNPECGGEYEPL
ncbi:hypothetical protein GQ457_03G042740 [Hibiscus cannabinus]